MFKGIVKKLVATAVVAASAFLAVVFLGVAIFYALSLTLTPLGAAAVTFGLFALVALFSLKARWRAVWPTLHGEAVSVRV